eukprot:3272573-Pyramimonas_sp.AAC.1
MVTVVPATLTLHIWLPSGRASSGQFPLKGGGALSRRIREAQEERGGKPLWESRVTRACETS